MVTYVAFKMKAVIVQEAIEDFEKGGRKAAVLIMYGCGSMTNGMEDKEIEEDATKMVIGAAV